MRTKLFLIIILLVLCTTTLSAKKEDDIITISYVTEPTFQLQFGPPSVLAGYSSGHTKIDPTDLSALLGTLILETTGNNLKSPKLTQVTISTNVLLKGYVKNSNGQIVYNSAIPVTLKAISVVRGNVVGSAPIIHNVVELAPNKGNIMPNAKIMHIYIVLVAKNERYDYFIPGVVYSLNENSTIGNFGFSATGQGNQNFTDIPIDVNYSGAGTPNAPFIPGASVPGAEVDLPFEGDGFCFNHEYIFTILSNPASFSLQQALMGLYQTVGTLQLQVTEAEKNKEYGVEIAFTSMNPSGFMLHLDGDLNQYGFPYKLHFGPNYQEITNNEFIVWKNLFTNNYTFATVEKTISVSVSDDLATREAPGGYYCDTVKIHIIPLDSVP